MSSKFQVYVGKTIIAKDDFYEMFEFSHNLNDEMSFSIFSLLMGLDYFDEDYLTIKYRQKSSLHDMLDYLSDFVKIDVADNIISNYDDIDFIVVVNEDEAYANEPMAKMFKNQYIDIKYLGLFDAEYAS